MLALAAALTVAGLVAHRRAEEVSHRLTGLVRESAARSSASGLATDFELDPEAPMPHVGEGDERAVGVLSAPSIGLEVPVLEAPGAPGVPYLYSGSIYRGDAVIAGGGAPGQFGRILELADGGGLTFTDVDGNAFSFTGRVREQLGEDEREAMVSSGFALTLFTSSAGGGLRDTLRCDASH